MSQFRIAVDDGGEIVGQLDGPDDAPPLLLLNSLGADAGMWQSQVADWASDRRVIRFDARGHGRSAVTPPPYTLDRLGRDAVQVLDHLDIDLVDVCGLSLGGLVAQWILIHAGERVDRIVLASTAPRIGTEQAWRDRAALVQAEGVEAVADLVMERFFSPSFRGNHPTVVAEARAVLAATAVEGYVGCCLALATADLRGLVDGIQFPTLVVVGSEDVATPQDQAEDLVARLPGAHLHTLNGAGHLANLEQPRVFARSVRDFLDGHRPVTT